MVLKKIKEDRAGRKEGIFGIRGVLGGKAVDADAVLKTMLSRIR